jgi:hypothetical protein
LTEFYRDPSLAFAETLKTRWDGRIVELMPNYLYGEKKIFLKFVVISKNWTQKNESELWSSCGRVYNQSG